ncbi:TIGR01620 family protein [Neiella sp. HB171785]|uniref:TIGR01620 family protein n=1 Tax=Neiella litorisoli TaxID=2771431 RepID=A0A8J6QL27_9GAMM|nr:TIGR01620 family protein [Neiella litorisoli]MBD1390326.1 TIGR01620 family protein [Neiella litorisoli]
MKSQGDSHQQQALFEEEPEFLEPQRAARAEPKQSESAENAETFEPQQIIDDEQSPWSEQAIELESTAPDEQPAVEDILRPAAKSHWWLKTIALLAATIVTIEGVVLANSVWQQQSWLSGLYALLFVLFFGGLLVLAFAEWRKLVQLSRTEQQQGEAQKIINGEQCDDIVRFSKALLPASLQPELSEATEQWQNLINDSQSDADVLTLYDCSVVSVCDQKALAVISKSSSQVAAVVALSPLAALDMFVIGWRNIRMINDVAACYGVELGFVSRLKLVRLVVYNLIYAGASELTLDIGLQSIGADLMGKVSARGAQGLGAGLLSARLGLKAMQLCRPLPFTCADSRPTLSTVMKQVHSSLSKKLKLVMTKEA